MARRRGWRRVGRIAERQRVGGRCAGDQARNEYQNSQHTHSPPDPRPLSHFAVVGVILDLFGAAGQAGIARLLEFRHQPTR